LGENEQKEDTVILTANTQDNSPRNSASHFVHVVGFFKKWYHCDCGFIFIFLFKSSVQIWYIHVIPTFGRLRQEDPKIKASLDYIVRPYHQKRNK
jgi:hypothetical protein